MVVKQLWLAQHQILDTRFQYHEKSKLFVHLFGDYSRQDQAIEGLWEVLHEDCLNIYPDPTQLSSHLKQLQKVCRSLQELDENPALDLAHAFLLNKAELMIRSIVMQKRLELMPVINDDLLYWEQRYTSYFSQALYMIETLPWVIKRRLSTLWDSTKKFKFSDGSFWLYDSVSMDNLSTVFVGLQHRIKPQGLFEISKRQMRSKVNQLNHIKASYARQMGLLLHFSSPLPDNGMVFGQSLAQTMLKNLSKKLDALDFILDDLNLGREFLLDTPQTGHVPLSR